MGQMRIQSGLYKGKQLEVFSGKDFRPTTARVREAAFNIWREPIKGSIFLELFAGTAAMTMEALSLGAARATVVEYDAKRIGLIRKNLIKLDVERQVEIIASDALAAVREGCFGAHLVYADPPYRYPRLRELVSVVAGHINRGPDTEEFILETSAKREEEIVDLLGDLSLPHKIYRYPGTILLRIWFKEN